MNRRQAAAVETLVAGLDIRDDVQPGRHGTIPIRTYRRPASSSGCVLVWVHGGSFSHGGLDQLESHAVAAAIAQHGHSVIAVDYRRVPPWSPFRDQPADTPLPGIRYPVPVDDVADVFTAAAARFPRVALGGASAGACLSAAVASRLSVERDPRPAQLILAYGTFHADLPHSSAQLRARIRGRHGLIQFRSATVRRMNHNYAGTAEALASPFAFPGGHPVADMPPTLILDADRDSLRASGEAYAAELAGAGTDVTHHVVPGSTHGFLDRPHTAAFTDGIRLITDYLRGRTVPA